MKYARAAWRIFLASAARQLHLPTRVVHELEDRASMAMFTCSLDFAVSDDWVDDPNVGMDEVMRRMESATGWTCDHFSITSGGGLTQPPACSHGCEMAPLASTTA